MLCLLINDEFDDIVVAGGRVEFKKHYRDRERGRDRERERERERERGECQMEFTICKQSYRSVIKHVCLPSRFPHTETAEQGITSARLRLRSILEGRFHRGDVSAALPGNWARRGRSQFARFNYYTWIKEFAYV